MLYASGMFSHVSSVKFTLDCNNFTGKLLYFKDQGSKACTGDKPQGIVQNYTYILWGDACAFMCAWPIDAPDAVLPLPGVDSGACLFLLQLQRSVSISSSATAERVFFFYSFSASNCNEWLLPSRAMFFLWNFQDL